MAKFELPESDYIKGTDIQGKNNVVFVILTEIKMEESNYGMRPKGTVSVKIGDAEPFEKLWTLNQQNQSFLVEKFGKESNDWKNKKLSVFTKTTSNGNESIQIKEMLP